MEKGYKVSDCHVIQLKGTSNRSGNMITAENLVDIPFEIKRVFYLYDIPGDASRGGHAHKELEQLIVAVSGSFDMTLDDGVSKKVVHLNRSNQALHLRPGIWKEMSNFSSGAICLSLASDKYDEDDYIRDYETFILKYGNN